MTETQASDVESELVDSIRTFCAAHGIAESTFGRLAVNDGKFVNRIAGGSRIETGTATRAYDFMKRAERGDYILRGRPRRKKEVSSAEKKAELISEETSVRTPGSFAFHEQRQRFHMFANTTNESWALADRLSGDLAALRPTGDGIRIFYAPMDNGVALTRILRAVHAHFPEEPVLVVVKGRSLEDLRNTMSRMVDRLAEHPKLVLVMTNMYMREAVNLEKQAPDNPRDLVWREIALEGSRSYDFQFQVAEQYGALAKEWLVRQGEYAQPVYECPSVVVIHRRDSSKALEAILPKKGGQELHYDYGVLNRPYLHSHTMKFRTDFVLKPLAERLSPGGRMTVVQSHGQDPAHEIVEKMWPGIPVPAVSRHDIIREFRRALGAERAEFTFGGLTDARSLYRFDMHTLPIFEGTDIGASALSSAWNNAVYYAQVKEELIQSAMDERSRHLEITRDVLMRNGGLWFVNEAFSATRKRQG